MLTCGGPPLWGQSTGPPVRETSPAVAAVLELPRDTPARQLRAILTLVDLGATEQAARVWAAWEHQNISATAHVELVEQFGTARLLKFSRQPAGLFPGARAFVENCQQTATQQARDPARLAQLVQDLAADSVTTRLTARRKLSAAGTAGAAACLTALAETTAPSLRSELFLALATIHPAADPLLLAVLAEGHGPLRRDVIELVGQLELFEAVPWLAALAVGASTDDAVTRAAQAALVKLGLSLPSTDEAVRLIQQKLAHVEAELRWETAADTDQATWWSLAAETGKLTSRALPAHEYQLLQMARLGHLLLHIPDTTAADRQQALIYAYQSTAARGEPLADEVRQAAVDLSTAALNEALARALANDARVAARGFMALLAERADLEALAAIPGTGQPAPLARALRQTDPQLRFAALQAVLQLAPQQTFAGASGVPAALWYFVARGGAPGAPGPASNKADWPREDAAGSGDLAPSDASAALRTEQARQALLWLADLLEHGHPYDELIRDSELLTHTVYREELTFPTLQVLALLEAPAAQRLLLDVASRNALPLATRQRAVEALATSVGRAGKLLQSDELLRQYQRYNASATASPATQALLGKILDILEAPHNAP